MVMIPVQTVSLTCTSYSQDLDAVLCRPELLSRGLEMVWTCAECRLSDNTCETGMHMSYLDAVGYRPEVGESATMPSAYPATLAIGRP